MNDDPAPSSSGLSGAPDRSRLPQTPDSSDLSETPGGLDHTDKYTDDSLLFRKAAKKARQTIDTDFPRNHAVNGKNAKWPDAEAAGMQRARGQDIAYKRPFMEVRELLSSIWRRKIYVIATTLLALAIVGLYLFITPKSYTATTQVLIDLNRPLTAEAQSIGADTTRFMMGPAIDSQVEIIRSSRVLRRVIEKTGYDDSADLSAEHAAENQTKGEVSLALLNRFREKLDVRRKGLTLILLVQFTDREAERSALMANTIAEEYLAERDSMEQAASRRAVETLKVRIAQARQDITNSEIQIQELSEEHNLFSMGGTTLDERGVTETATQLNLARSEASKLLADLQQWEADSKDNTGFATIGKIAEARRNYEVASNRLLILEKNLAELKREYARKSTAMNRYLELQKEVQSTGELYLALAARIKQLETERNYSMLDVQILDRAAIPETPSSPNLRLALAGGLVGGLGLGLSLALIRDHLSGVLRTPLLVQSNLGVPHIASLGRLHGRNADRFANFATQSNSPFVQGILTIYHSLAEPRNRGQHIIAIVSANDGDGKSTIAAALAHYASSFANQSTALIDCDIHQRTLSKRFAPTVPHSFAQAVKGTLRPASVMTIPEGCAFSLCTAPADENTLSSAELLMSPGMANFVKTTGRKHDLVVLDTPSLLKNVETRALVNLADSVILIINTRSTTVDNISTAKELIPGLEGKLIGAVLNFVG
jgi:succinoglycan biosynthesis transport protein ExoP